MTALSAPTSPSKTLRCARTLKVKPRRKPEPRKVMCPCIQRQLQSQIHALPKSNPKSNPFPQRQIQSQISALKVNPKSNPCPQSQIQSQIRALKVISHALESHFPCRPPSTLDHTLSNATLLHLAPSVVNPELRAKRWTPKS